MGEAPRGPSVPEPEGLAAVVGTSKHEPDKVVRPKHRHTLSLPSTMPSTSASDSDEEEGSHVDDETHNSVTTSTTVTTLTGPDSTSEGSSDEDEKGGKVSLANSEASTLGALASSPKGKISFTGGRGSKSKATSMTNLQGGSLRNSKVHGQQQRALPKKKPKPKGMHKTARFGIGERDSEDEGKRNKNEHSISWSRKSLHRAKIAKDYTTSESEDEVPDAKPLGGSQHHYQTPTKSSSGKKPSIKVVGDSKKLPNHTRRHAQEKGDGNSSTDSETSTTTTTATDDSDDDEEERDENGAERRRIHSRKPSLNQSPTQVKNSRVKIADEDAPIPASSGRENYRSDVESHDADHEHELWEEDQDDDTDDDRRIQRMKRSNQGNSASFSEHVSRSFRWSTFKTKIFYSFRARGNDSDDEGSKALSARNLAPAVNEQILREFFGGCGAVTSVNISRDEFGRCSGSAYVEFDCGRAARKALQKTGTRLLERVVFCDVAHETTTSRHIEPKTEPPPAPPPAATAGGIDMHSRFLKAFHRADNSEGSVRSRPKKSKSSESLHFPRGLISPGDTITASSGNEQSVHDPNANGESIGGGGSRKRFFGYSRSSGSGSHSLKVGGSQSRVQTDSRELEQSKSQSREIEVQLEIIEVQPRGITQSRGIEVQTRSIGIIPHSSAIPEIVFQEGTNEGLEPPRDGHNSKRKKWSFRRWHRKQRWVKMSWLKWVKKPRWHWWHFANLSARWGKASASTQSVKTTPPPLPEAEPPEGYPCVSFQ